MHSALLVVGVCLLASNSDIPIPKVLDSRLKIELVAAEPDIVTPTGLAVDSRGRVLVVESHTHFRPAGYEGPPADRIRMFQDTNGDGRADRIGTFFEGTTWTMNVGVHPDGSVYVATRGEIFRLRDTDDDGRADERRQIMRLETEGDYPHNGLSGFAFDLDGSVYFGLGENKGASFKLIGTDGSTASELEGGQVYRCRADGSHVEMLASGFWNPFHVAIDACGRVFAVDNDPDSLPPCRLLHIVAGGNYGYRYRNGRKGVHPFTAWNGELPGTLPMVAGTGEAPSGLVAYESDNLPSDYVDTLLSTSWGDHRIEQFRLEPRGASFRSVSNPIVVGDENFRPVGIALAPDGSLYISDWVSRSYEVHGKGRVWRLSAVSARQAHRPTDPTLAIKSDHGPLRERAARQLLQDARGQAVLRKLAVQDEAESVRALCVRALGAVGRTDVLAGIAKRDPSPGVRAVAVRGLKDEQIDAELLSDVSPAEARAEALRKAQNPALAETLWRAVSNPDAFIAAAARRALGRLDRDGLELVWHNRSPAERLAALLILREAGKPQSQQKLAGFLRDPDADVRFAAVQWIGEERLTGFRDKLDEALAAGPATSRLFGGYLAALERLDGVVRTADDEWAGEQYIVRAIDDPRTTPEVRRWAVRMLRADHPLLTLERLQTWIDGDDVPLRLEAVRTLRETQLSGRTELLAQIADSTHHTAQLRAEAVVGLSGEDPVIRQLLLKLATGADASLRNEALRSLRGCTLLPPEQTTLEQIGRGDCTASELVARVLNPASRPHRPATSDTPAWTDLLLGGAQVVQGDPAAGERIFFHPRSAGCSHCHQIMGRGARVGPELTASAGALPLARFVDSIIRPSQEVAPHFASWSVVTTAGKTLVGMLVKEEATGEQTYADNKGELTRLKPGEIELRKPLSTSIMPEGLGDLLTVQEFRDLLAFLQSAHESRPQTGG
jgi:putative membrane-bound dehydrogenase-like protein